MDSKPQYKSSLAFTDLLFNIVLGFAFMFIIAFLLINPVEKDAQIEAKAEFMIIMEWDHQSAYDIDLWMMDPVGNIVGFPNMHAGLLHLDKDDLGQSNDSVILADGTKKIIYLNREIMTIRGIVPGEYIVNNHLYSMKSDKSRKPMEVTTRVIKINPFGEVHVGVVTLRGPGAEETVIRFTISPNGFVKSKNRRQKRFAGKRQPGGNITSAGSTTTAPNRPPPGSEGTRIAGPGQGWNNDDGEMADDDELHEQTGAAGNSANSPSGYGGSQQSDRDIGDAPSGTEESRYGANATMVPGTPFEQNTEPHAEEEDPAMGGF